MMQHSLLIVRAGGDDLRRATTKHQVHGVDAPFDAALAQQFDEGEIVVGRGRTNNEGGPFVISSPPVGFTDRGIVPADNWTPTPGTGRIQ